MIKDFETVIKQLQDLSTVVNNFKSEAVQLRIIELVFKGVTAKETEENDESPEEETGLPEKKQARKSRKSGSNKEEKAEKTSPAKGRPGPLKTLEQLVTDGFFKSSRTIGAIVQHCKDNLTLTYRSTVLSGPLMKLVRDKKLKRAKNSATSQYEYTNA